MELKVKALGRVLEQISFEFGDPPEHVQPTSIWQSLLQPSLLKLLPSSHGKVNLFPSPQV